MIRCLSRHLVELDYLSVIERNWSPVWSLFRHERNPRTGAESRSLLWNLWREEAGPTGSHASFFFGIARRDRDEAGVKWRWFDWEKPVTGEAKPAAK